MAYDFEKNIRSGTRAETDIDLGLKAYMNKVYSFMAVGLALTGTIAHMFSQLAFNFETNQYYINILQTFNIFKYFIKINRSKY